MVVVVVVVVAVRLAYVVVLYFVARSRPLKLETCQRSFFLYCDMCFRFRGCPVLPHVELPVSARYKKTRVLLRCSSERQCAAKKTKIHAIRVKQNNVFVAIIMPEDIDFSGPATAKWPLPLATERSHLNNVFFHMKSAFPPVISDEPVVF